VSSIDVHRQHYNVTFTLLALAAVAFSLLQSLVAPALLTIQHDLHTTTAGAAWILSAYLLSASVVTPIAGRPGDMFGKKLMLVAVLVMRLRGVWATNLAALVFGFGMYSSFVLVPEFVELPTSTAFGFGASVTKAGLFVVPATIGMLLAGPVSGRLSTTVGSKVPLLIGALVSSVAFVILAVAHGRTGFPPRTGSRSPSLRRRRHWRLASSWRSRFPQASVRVKSPLSGNWR